MIKVRESAFLNLGPVLKEGLLNLGSEVDIGFYKLRFMARGKT
jgi:hypothetical protein